MLIKTLATFARCRLLLAAAIFATALFTNAATAEVKVTSEHNSTANADFKFDKVPAPSKTDAGNLAEMKILSGRLDANGGSLKLFNNGRLATTHDDPEHCVFFDPQTDRGRILLSWPKAIDVRHINTYSWHAAARGPQRYKVYGASAKKDATAKHDFDPAAAKSGDPAKLGWTFIAEVDTRPAEGPLGGQYGVSIADTTGGSLGEYRYLLFEISKTSAVVDFSNTFFTEIDIVDGQQYDAPPEPVGAKPEVLKIADKYEITFEFSEMPELRDWIVTKLMPVCEKWYPMIVEMLPSDGYSAPTKVTVNFRPEMSGVAHATGTQIFCSGRWIKQNLDGEAIGAIVHELVHVVQQYPGRRAGKPNPGWMVEGVADFVRWFHFEPERLRPRVNPDRAKHTDSYQTTAAFLNYVSDTHDKDLVKKFNAEMRAGNYDEALWKTYTGKSADELWLDFARSIRAGNK